MEGPTGRIPFPTTSSDQRGGLLGTQSTRIALMRQPSLLKEQYSVEDLRDCFEALDHSSKGYISYDDLFRATEAVLGAGGFSQNKMKQACLFMDQNENNSIEWFEFRMFMLSQTPPSSIKADRLLTKLESEQIAMVNDTWRLVDVLMAYRRSTKINRMIKRSEEYWKLAEGPNIEPTSEFTQARGRGFYVSPSSRTANFQKPPLPHINQPGLPPSAPHRLSIPPSSPTSPSISSHRFSQPPATPPGSARSTPRWSMGGAAAAASPGAYSPLLRPSGRASQRLISTLVDDSMQFSKPNMFQTCDFLSDSQVDLRDPRVTEKEVSRSQASQDDEGQSVQLRPSKSGGILTPLAPPKQGSLHENSTPWPQMFSSGSGRGPSLTSAPELHIPGLNPSSQSLFTHPSKQAPLNGAAPPSWKKPLKAEYPELGQEAINSRPASRMESLASTTDVNKQQTLQPASLVLMGSSKGRSSFTAAMARRRTGSGAAGEEYTRPSSVASHSSLLSSDPFFKIKAVPSSSSGTPPRDAHHRQYSSTRSTISAEQQKHTDAAADANSMVTETGCLHGAVQDDRAASTYHADTHMRTATDSCVYQRSESLLSKKPTSLGMPQIRGVSRLGAAELAAFSTSPNPTSPLSIVTPQSMDRRTEPGLHDWHSGAASLEHDQALSRSGSEEARWNVSEAGMQLGLELAESGQCSLKQGADSVFTRNNSLQLEPRRKVSIKGQMSNGIILTHVSATRLNLSARKLGGTRK
ncbi:hypothetical protein CEUSTIGMA_g11555.t1 [Chlamydomonas eustigma]|uniref:EF-hand domain-containing protein n=1 Tax=Chlamydomonas eustigma TaxID=1157962 RepID=A0A250XMK8_9CHLO|nr:hypothetical protein CEUSTIGMA_g11555.t1 [Chlamydomonas eustigma]|eukprot:GAX84132.1 hypothetical protein CEUSTIGMA_g11555.t1 [Chlamydomonas eustigma]